MNILVTGGNGQLGLEIRRCITFKNKWFFVDHNELDILDKDKVSKIIYENDIDVVINCAAYTKFDACKQNKAKAFDINSKGPEILAEIMRKKNGLLIHISTDYVFDGNRRFSFYETTDKPNPISIYGKTKNQGDQNVIKSGCKYLIFRVSWLYGGKKNNFVKTMYDKLDNDSIIRVVNDQTGTPTYVYDFAKFIVEILDKFEFYELKNKCGIYHFANKGKTTWFKLTKYIKKYKAKYDRNFINGCMIKKIKTNDYPSEDVRPKYSPLSIKKTEREFNYSGGRNWKKALKECIIRYIKETN